MLTDIFLCVCVLKKDDIFINWSLWTIVGSIILPKPLIDYGLSSNQTRTNDIRNVVLLVVDPSSIHHYIFWVWPMLSLVHIIMEFHLHGNLDELLLSPSATFLSSPWFMLNIQLVLETFIRIIFMTHSWSICSDVRSDFLWFICIWCKLPPWTRESQCCFLWNHSKSVMHTCEECCGLKTCNLQSICIPSTPSHWLICSRRRSSFIRANPDLWRNFDTLVDGSPSWTR